MKITGLETLTFGVENVAQSTKFLINYGLIPVNVTEAGGRFEGLDGTAVVIALKATERRSRQPPPADCARPRWASPITRRSTISKPN